MKILKDTIECVENKGDLFPGMRASEVGESINKLVEGVMALSDITAGNEFEEVDDSCHKSDILELINTTLGVYKEDDDSWQEYDFGDDD